MDSQIFPRFSPLLNGPFQGIYCPGVRGSFEIGRTTRSPRRLCCCYHWRSLLQVGNACWHLCWVISSDIIIGNLLLISMSYIYYIYIHCIHIYIYTVYIYISISIPTWISFYVKVEHLYFSGLKCPYWLVILPSLLLSCWDSTWEVPTWPPPAMWSSYIPCWHRMRSEPWGMRCRSEEKWWPLPSGKCSHNYGLNHHAINGKINYFDWAID